MNHGKLSASLVLIAATFLLAAADSSHTTETPFDRDWYDYLVASEYTSLNDIADDFDITRFEYLPILPPDPDLYMIESSGDGIRGFDARKFPKDFVNGLIPEAIDGTTVYRLTVYEDTVTRDRVFLNAKDEEIARLPAPADYSPTEYVSQMYGTIWCADTMERNRLPLDEYLNPFRWREFLMLSGKEFAVAGAERVAIARGMEGLAKVLRVGGAITAAPYVLYGGYAIGNAVVSYGIVKFDW